jgi:hypothetical protein
VLLGMQLDMLVVLLVLLIIELFKGVLVRLRSGACGGVGGSRRSWTEVGTISGAA